VRVLIDECLSRAVADLLREHGHDAIHVGDRGLLGHADPEVMGCALGESRILVSADTDFGELLARSNAALPSVVLLRRTVRAPTDQAATVDEVLRPSPMNCRRARWWWSPTTESEYDDFRSALSDRRSACSRLAVARAAAAKRATVSANPHGPR
jgi:predicted nuclease of predicted toxin-antitoxin system